MLLSLAYFLFSKIVTDGKEWNPTVPAPIQDNPDFDIPIEFRSPDVIDVTGDQQVLKLILNEFIHKITFEIYRISKKMNNLTRCQSSKKEIKLVTLWTDDNKRAAYADMAVTYYVGTFTNGTQVFENFIYNKF